MAIIPTQDVEEVLFRTYDEGWRRELPTTLITYPDGSQDLHRQTGSQFVQDVERAKVLLALRGLRVEKVGTIGATGAYMTVRPL